jgi:hypothetical protein
MAKVTHAARNHAARLKMERLKARANKGKKRRRKYEEELGDDALSSIPIIGSLLGGLLGGGGGGDQKGADTGGGGAMMMGPSPSGPNFSLGDIRGVIQDALGVFGDRQDTKQTLQQSMAQQARGAVDMVSAALDPTLRAARGGTQVQRLQTQATSEHNTLQRAADRRRVIDERDTRINQKLDRLVATVAAIQSRIGGSGAAVITDPMMRDILNVR